MSKAEFIMPAKVCPEFGLHAVFITPNKEMRLLRNYTRSAIVVHRRELKSALTSLSWEALDEFHQQRVKAQRESSENIRVVLHHVQTWQGVVVGEVEWEDALVGDRCICLRSDGVDTKFF